MPVPRQQLADVIDILCIVFDSLQQDIEAQAEAGAARVALARSASVCRLFYELAVPMLWRHIPGEPMFALPRAYGFLERKEVVVEDDGGDGETVYKCVLAMPAKDVLAHQNWKRFLAYTQHVRTIDSLSMTNLSFWEDLVQSQPVTGQVILPRLVKMSIDIKYPTDRYCEPALVAMLASAPDLTDLSLPYTLAHCELPSVAGMIYNQPPTQTIPIVPILAHLRSLTVTGECIEAGLVSGYVAGRLSHPARLQHLTLALTAETNSGIPNSSLHIYTCLLAVTEVFRELQSIALVKARDADGDPTATALSFDPAFRTLLRLHALRQVNLTGFEDSVDLTDNDVIAMARRWPDAEEIRWEPPCGSVKASLWSIQGFAMYCPRLRVLRLPSMLMGTSDLHPYGPELPGFEETKTKTKTALVEVAIGGRPIQEYASESADVRAFVECVFPGLLAD